MKSEESSHKDVAAILDFENTKSVGISHPAEIKATGPTQATKKILVLIKTRIKCLGSNKKKIKKIMQ